MAKDAAGFVSAEHAAGEVGARLAEFGGGVEEEVSRTADTVGGVKAVLAAKDDRVARLALVAGIDKVRTHAFETGRGIGASTASVHGG